MKNIISKIQNILDSRFKEPEKKQIITNDNDCRLACPYCGDSSTNVRKKRGNFYFNSLMYVCYNCSTKKPITSVLSDFNEPLPLDDILTLEKQIKANTKAYSPDMELSGIEHLLIDRDQFEKDFRIEKASANHLLMRSRFIENCQNFGTKDDKIYIYNLLGNKILGMTIRQQKAPKYKAYPLPLIWKDFYSQEIDDNHFFRTYSLLFNYFQLNTNKMITVVEGPIDASFIHNSVALGGIAKSLKTLEFFDNKRFLFDNDEAGKKIANKLIKQNESVFMWNKFLKDFELSENCKDVNDVAMENSQVLDHIDDYFTKNKMDILYV